MSEHHPDDAPNLSDAMQYAEALRSKVGSHSGGNILRPALRCARRGAISTPIPRRAHPGDAGLDLHAALSEPLFIPEHYHTTIPTGWAVEVPAGFVGLVLPRSGLAKSGVVAACGVIDHGYSGEVCVNLFNHRDHPTQILPGGRIAQLVLVPCLLAEPVEVAELGESERGANGFGSTGR